MSEMTTSTSFVLSVDGAHFREGLKRFLATRNPQARDRASFAFDGTFLTVDSKGSSFAARASGTWPGVATCNASVIPALAASPPVGGSVPLRYGDGRLGVGSLSVAAEWTPVSAALSDTPAAPDWVQALSLKYTTDRSRLLQSGRIREVDAVEKKLAATIAKAAKTLAPLGVEDDDLRRLVDEVLAKRWAAPDKR